jgi:5-methylcytosine-specific restriction protein A
MRQRKIPDTYNKFLIEPGPRHKIAGFRKIFSDHEAIKRIQELREGYDWTTYIDISMLIPICADCKFSADNQFGEHALPEIEIGNWKVHYQSLGIDKDIICFMEQEIGEDNWEWLFCFKCLKQVFQVIGKNFYVFSTPLTDYYGCQKSPGRSSLDWMKSSIFKEYENRWNSCEKVFAVKDLTIDHIFPSDSGGRAEFQNLQPLCQACNKKKSNNLPKIIYSHITAELFPPETDCKLGTTEKRLDFSNEDFLHPLAKFFYQKIAEMDWVLGRRRGTENLKGGGSGGFLLG